MHDAAATIAPPPQHMQALAKANEVRLARAGVKRQIAHRELTVAAVILEPPACCMSMTMAELLCSQWRWGTDTTSKFLAKIRMPETKTVGSLTPRQRRALAAIL